MEAVIDFRKIFRQLYTKLWLIVAATVAVSAAGLALTWTVKPDVYSARATLVGTGNNLYSVLESTQIMRNYVDMVQSARIADAVVAKLPDEHLNTAAVQKMLTSSYDKTTDSALFYITAETSDRELSMAVANAAAEAFRAEMEIISGVSLATVVDEATTATLSFDGQLDRLKVRIEFALGGWIGSCTVLALIALFGKKVTEIDDCTLQGGLELLGVIPAYDTKPQTPQIQMLGDTEWIARTMNRP